MTLKEKFYIAQQPFNFEPKTAEKCETIADEFAIGFAKWIKDDGRTIELLKGSRTPKKLLEIYKKEKGL